MEAYSGAGGDIRFEIVEFIGVLADHSTGWKKELNLVSWNGGAPKYDIRDWDPGHERMSRGITLHEHEMRHIFELMRRRGQRHYNTRNEAAIERLAAKAAAERAPVMQEDAAPMQPAIQEDLCEEQEVMEAIAEEKEQF